MMDPDPGLECSPEKSESGELGLCLFMDAVETRFHRFVKAIAIIVRPFAQQRLRCRLNRTNVPLLPSVFERNWLERVKVVSFQHDIPSAWYLRVTLQ
jgi:hypothetical protein